MHRCWALPALLLPLWSATAPRARIQPSLARLAPGGRQQFRGNVYVAVRNLGGTRAPVSVLKYNNNRDYVTGWRLSSLEVAIPDPAHSEAELRFASIGLSEAGRLLVVAYPKRGQHVRIISAREAAPKERRQYESRG